MSAVEWLVMIVVLLVVFVGALLVARRARRSGSVLASKSPDGGRQ